MMNLTLFLFISAVFSHPIFFPLQFRDATEARTDARMTCQLLCRSVKRLVSVLRVDGSGERCSGHDRLEREALSLACLAWLPQAQVPSSQNKTGKAESAKDVRDRQLRP